MGQIMKKVLCSLLAVLMIAGAVPVNAIAFELEKVGESIPVEEEVAAPETEEIEREAGTFSATAPEKVTDTIIEEKFKKLNSLKEKFFTTTGKPCAYISGHGCSNCGTTKLVSSGKVKELLGIAPKSGADTTYLPNIRWITPNNNLGKQGTFTFPVQSCLAFASIAHWYLYAQKSTDKVTEIHIADFDYKKENMNSIKNIARKGDIILFKDQLNPSSQHAGIYVDCGSSGIKVLDCNWNGSNVGNCKIQEHIMSWSQYKYIVISRANTYVEHSYDNKGYCSHCGKYYEEINKVTSIDGTVSSTENIYVKPHPYQGESGTYQDKLKAGTYKIVGKIANHYGNTWYKISYGSSKTGWVYPEDHITVTINNTINVELSMNKYTIPKGTSVWANDSSKAYNWYGKVSSSNGISKITSVTFEILNEDGSLTTSSNRITKKPNATSYTVKTADDTMKFSSLAVGEYILSLRATDENGKTGSKQVNFTVVDSSSSNVPVTGISLDYSDISIFKNDPFTLTATVYPSNATNKTVKWSSADTSVATVSSSGAVTGVSAGTTVITATTADGNYSASCDVEVIGDTYTITYDLNGGTWSRSNTQIKYEKQETYLAREIPVKEGFVFGGWEEIGECYELSPEKPESGDYTTYYKYYIWGYEHDSDYTYLYGNDKDELIDHIKKNAKTFGNYNPKKMRYFYLYETADKGSSFYPGKSGSNYNYFEAEYFSEGGEAGTAKIYKTEFYFEQRMYGYLTLGRFVHQAGDMYVVDEDLYLTAIWEYPESFNVYFDANGGHGGIEYLLVEGTQFTVPDTEDCIPVFENWLFLYWFDDEGIYEPGKTYTINEDKYLIAGWAPDWEPEITVGNITGKPGEVVSVPVNIMNNFYPDLARIEFDVICDGLTFFNFEQVGTPLHGLLGYLHIQIPDDAVAGRTYPVQLILNELVIEEKYDITELAKVTNGSITIEEFEKEYTVTFDPGKGTGGPEDITVTGNEFTVPTEIPVRENWNFLFWMGQNGKGYHPGNTYSITENLDLVAIFEPGWMPEISVENVAGKPGEKVELRVTIANNMENPEERSIITGIQPYRDEREDHVFGYTVTELPQNGMIGKISFTIPEDAEPGMVYKATIRSDKWVVSGFDMASSEMLKFTNGSITVEEPEKTTYTVTYDANGGSGAPEAQTKTEGEALKLSTKKPVREGYEFLGWATSKTAATAQYQPGDSYTKDANVTLYAVWKQKEVIPEDAPTIVIGEVSGKPGETVEVPVVLKNNPGVAVIGFDIVYDKTAIKLVDYEDGGLSDWLIGVGKGEKANWVDEKGSSFNGEILVLIFEILEDTKDGSVEIAFTNFKAGDKDNNKLNFVIVNGKIKVVSRVPGDSNNDGEVDVFDLLILRKHLAGIPEEIDLNASDVNVDGEVDVFDLLLFRKYLAGMDVELK
ncbi:MAG: InlB B-repeat-containing protein [Oscillospiraceae bacterium]|nr:InlB B-repeat-containing protein [Oscillospiraceae bacterium]